MEESDQARQRRDETLREAEAARQQRARFEQQRPVALQQAEEARRATEVARQQCDETPRRLAHVLRLIRKDRRGLASDDELTELIRLEDEQAAREPPQES